MALVSGAIDIKYLVFPKSSFKCKISGNLCATSCTFVDNIQQCPYRQIEFHYLNIGQIFVLCKLYEASDMENKDFTTRVFTGSSLIEKLPKGEDSLYNPLKNLIDINDLDESFVSIKETEIPNISSSKDSSTTDIITSEYFNMIKNLREEEATEKLQGLQKFIESFDNENKVPSYILKIKKSLETPPKRFNIYSWNEIKTYIFKEDLSDLQRLTFLKYLIFAFKPSTEDDFPYYKVNKNKIANLITKTAGISEDMPNKWTNKRKFLVEKAKNPYYGRIYYDDKLYLWIRFGNNVVPNKLTESDIRLKVFLDAFLSKIAHHLSSYSLIYINEVKTIEWISFIASQLQILHNIYNSLFFIKNFSDFFLGEQLNNQYIYIGDKSWGELTELLFTEYGKIDVSPIERLEYYKKEKLVKEFTLFKIHSSA